MTIYITRLPFVDSPSEQRRMLSDAAYALLDYAMRERGYDADCLTLCRTPQGKPYFVNHAVEFSLSHSGMWAVCALSNAPVGVDIERIRPISERVWKRFLAEHAHEPYQDDREATLRWTRYEASLKRVGVVTPLPVGATFTTIPHIPGYLLTLCGEGRPDPLRMVPYYALQKSNPFAM